MENRGNIPSEEGMRSFMHSALASISNLTSSVKMSRAMKVFFIHMKEPGDTTVSFLEEKCNFKLKEYVL